MGNKIRKVAVVGFGTLGKAVVYHCAVAGYETYAYDTDIKALEKGKTSIEKWLDERTGDGRLQSEVAKAALSRLHFSNDLSEVVSDAEMVVESVPENLELKRQVMSDIDSLAPQEAILASSTSSIPCFRFADATNRPDKVINMHFVSLPDFPLADLMWGPDTAKQTIIKADAFVRSLGKSSVLIYKEIFGCGFPRIWHAVKKEALWVVDKGYMSFEDIDRYWMHLTGSHIGIFGILDLSGLDTIRDIEMSYYLESGKEEDKPPQILDDLISQGRLGTKTGQGFYSYPNPDYEKEDWLFKIGQWQDDLALTLKKEK
jgi:3-hydroxybutyryl-CoA dehydrogenase